MKLQSGRGRAEPNSSWSVRRELLLRWYRRNHRYVRVGRNSPPDRRPIPAGGRYRCNSWWGKYEGGRGTLIGTLIAVAILGVVQNGFALLQFSSYLENTVLGVLLIVAVLTDRLVRRAEV